MLWERLREAMLRHPEQTVGEGSAPSPLPSWSMTPSAAPPGLPGKSTGFTVRLS